MPDAAFVESHDVSLAIWELSSPLIVDRPVTFNVGAKCSANCALSGCVVQLRNAEGSLAASAELGTAPWPGTAALFWAELTFTAPLNEGSHSWNLILARPGAGAVDPHAARFDL